MIRKIFFILFPVSSLYDTTRSSIDHVNLYRDPTSIGLPYPEPTNLPRSGSRRNHRSTRSPSCRQVGEGRHDPGCFRCYQDHEGEPPSLSHTVEQIAHRRRPFADSRCSRNRFPRVPRYRIRTVDPFVRSRLSLVPFLVTLVLRRTPLPRPLSIKVPPLLSPDRRQPPRSPLPYRIILEVPRL